MKRPSFQFYPGDWQANSNLRRCSHAEKGVWVDVMCLLHDQEEYGVLRWTLKEIAQAVGCTTGVLKGIVTKGVLKGCDTQLNDEFVYTPRSGRKDGESVTLVGTQAGPIWYSSRMVKDEYVRANAGAATRFGAEDGNKQPPRQAKEGSDRAKLRLRVLDKTGGTCYHCSTRLGDVWEIDHLMPRSKGGRHTFANLVPSCVSCNQDKSDTLPDDWDALKLSPTRRVGERLGVTKGDGSTSPSSSSASQIHSVTDVTGGKPPKLTPDEIIFGYGLPLLTNAGTPEKQARSFLGALRKRPGGDEAVVNVLRDCIRAKPLQPLEWLAKAMPPSGSAAKPNAQEALEASNNAVLAKFLAEDSHAAQ